MMVALGIGITLAIVALIVGWLCRTDIRNKLGYSPKPSLTEARKLLASAEFEAWTHCPNCGRYAVHQWREAKKPGRGALDDEMHYMYSHLVWSIGTPSLKMPYPSSEWGFTVIRICACSKEWGQK